MLPSITFRRCVEINIYINGEEAVISARLPNRLFDKYFYLLPLGSLASLQTQWNLGAKVGTTKTQPRMQFTRSMTVSCLGFLFFSYTPQSQILMNESKCQSHTHVFHYLVRVVYRAHIQNKQAVFRALKHEHVQFFELTFGDCFDYR